MGVLPQLLEGAKNKIDPPTKAHASAQGVGEGLLPWMVTLF